MIVFRDPSEVPAGFGPSVVAIGKFDGVHSGHRAVIDRARVAAEDAGARVVAVTFDRNPLSLLRPELCPEPLVSLDQKLRLLAEQGIDGPVRPIEGRRGLLALMHPGASDTVADVYAELLQKAGESTAASGNSEVSSTEDPASLRERYSAQVRAILSA